MPSKTIAKTDGSVVILVIFLFFVRWGTRNGPTRSNARKGLFKHTPLHKPEKVGLKGVHEAATLKMSAYLEMSAERL